jgi:hypothetical protein
MRLDESFLTGFLGISGVPGYQESCPKGQVLVALHEVTERAMIAGDCCLD